MRWGLQTAPLLLIGVALIGCGKESAPQGKVDPALPVVSVKVGGMT